MAIITSLDHQLVQRVQRKFDLQHGTCPRTHACRGGDCHAFPRRYLRMPVVVSSSALVGLFSKIDSGSWKVIFSSYQIIQSISLTVDVVFPSPFSGMLNFLSF